MIATAAPISTLTEATTRRAPLWRIGLLASVAAAVATTVVAAIARASDVPLEVDRDQLPLPAFAQLTLFAALLGLLLAKALTRWTAKPRRTFAVVTVALTVLSIVPDLATTATTATKAVLITTHLVAAAIVIPTVASRLPTRTR